MKVYIAKRVLFYIALTLVCTLLIFGLIHIFTSDAPVFVEIIGLH